MMKGEDLKQKSKSYCEIKGHIFYKLAEEGPMKK